MRNKIPEPVVNVMNSLEEGGFEAFIVGGSVRDLLLDREPKDWDITTNARPEEIQKLFPESVYENTFGTVGVKVPRFQKSTPETQEKDLIEVTTYRVESNYTDARHPDKVQFTNSLEQDLSRRDFTINAMAYGKRHDGTAELIDPFGGVTDLKDKTIRTVGSPDDRFEEDALRLLRAVRLATEVAGNGKALWKIEEETLASVKAKAPNLKVIAQERIRDEFSKIILSPRAADGIELLRETGLLSYILPELELGIGVTQNLHHIYTVYEHNVRALATVPSTSLAVRLAALLHDVGKPHTKKGNGKYATFYNHDHVGARITEKALTRLRYPSTIVKKAALLVDNHLFYYNVGEVTEASVRRLIKRVGLENMDDLMAVRIGDRLGSGVPKAKPYKLRHLEYMIERVSKDPLSVKMLALKGTDLIEVLRMPPGPKIGAILDILLAEVIEDPQKNTKALLMARAKKLAQEDLEQLRVQAKRKIEGEKESEDISIKKKHWVE